MLQLVNKEEAEEILESFSQPGIEWIEGTLKETKYIS